MTPREQSPGAPSLPARLLSRRVFVVGLVAAVAMAFPLRRLRGRLLAAHHVSQNEGPPLDAGSASSDTIASFAGALFGHDLSESERHEVSTEVAWLTEIDPGFTREFVNGALALDTMARASDKTPFSTAPFAARLSIVDRIMKTSLDARASRLTALWSPEERACRRLRGQVVPVLARVYPASSVLWRRRGYARRPGDARDPREYTAPGATAAC